MVELGVLLLFGLVFTRDGFVSNGSLGMATNLCRGTGSVLLFGLGSGTKFSSRDSLVLASWFVLFLRIPNDGIEIYSVV